MRKFSFVNFRKHAPRLARFRFRFFFDYGSPSVRRNR
ncbi:hypothetical protein [Porphyromonas gulae]